MFVELNKQIVVLFFLLTAGLHFAYSQFAIGISAISGALHIDNKLNRFLYVNSLFPKKTFNYELGGVISIQHYFGKTTQFSIWGLQGIFRDAANKLAGFTGIEGKSKLFTFKKTMAELGIGIALSYRKTWRNFWGYIPEPGYHSWQEIEYKPAITASYTHLFYISNTSDILFSFLYNFEKETVFLSAGIRIWYGLEKPCGCNQPYKRKHFI